MGVNNFPLHEAAKLNSYHKLSNTLRQVRVSVELRDEEGKTALYICAEMGNPMTVKLLMQSGRRKTRSGSRAQLM